MLAFFQFRSSCTEYQFVTFIHEYHQQIIFLRKSSKRIEAWTKWSESAFPDEFCWMEIIVFLVEFHWSVFLNVQLAISQHWFRQWFGTKQATCHYLNQWWHKYGIIRPQWVNFQRPDNISTILGSTRNFFFFKNYQKPITFSVMLITKLAAMLFSWPPIDFFCCLCYCLT